MAVTTMIGARIQRREDPRLVTGRGRYVDDLQVAGMAHVHFVRSPHSHARINSIDITAAMRAPGVAAVYTAADFASVLQGATPVTNSFVNDKKQAVGWAFIAADECHYQGEIVAVVVAAERSQAADAAALVEVDYEPLPAVVDLDAAMRPDSPTAHSDGPDNIAWDLVVGQDVDEPLARADVRVKERILQQRLMPIAMEGRGTIAEYVPFENKLTLWTSTQVSHWVRLCLALAMGIPESSIRVIAPDVGGGFGSKIHIYPEDYLLAAASRLCGSPLKWVETRSENLQATHHGRGQIFDVEAGANRDGKLVALKITQLLDTGAYLSVFSSFQTSAYLVATGSYNWEAAQFHTVGVLTNKTPTDAYRGAGRPEATHAVERIVDMLARELGMDPAEIRRRNFISSFPHTNYLGLVYDTGNYPGALDKALSIAGYDELRRRQQEMRAQGRYLGIGLSAWIEICGFGPSGPSAAAEPLALVESSMVRVHPTGSATIFTGTLPHGQGHDTTFAQIAADTLGIPMEQIEVRHGDTSDTPFGYGTYGSRSLTVGGISVLRSAQKVVEKARTLAAHWLEVDEADLEFEGGKFTVKGSPDRFKSMADIALAAHRESLPPGVEYGLEAVTYFDPPDFSWPFGVHVCVVEVDPETGSVDLQRYVAVDDCGNVVNPLIVEGQLHGGIAQGIAQALFEEVVYDRDTGQLKTGTLLDYSVPTANEIPDLELGRTVTPSTTNELGAKGIGEAGTIAASPAVINAICDALAPFGIRHVDMPASPDRLWRQINQQRPAAGSNGGGPTGGQS